MIIIVPFLIQAIIIFLISLFTFLPSFRLGLFGDDWVMLWIYMHHLGPQAITATNHFTFFLSGYGPYEVTMGLIYRVFGDNSLVYYLLSYSFRLMAALALWPLIFYLTRSKLAAFFGALFLSVTYIGLETTNWVFNMTSYLAITFLSLFMYFFIKSREELKIKLFIFSVVCFYLGYIFATIRMTGLLPFAILLEVFFYFRSSRKKGLFSPKEFMLSTLRLIILTFVFVIIASMGAVNQTEGKLLDSGVGVIISGIQKSVSMIQSGEFIFLFNPFLTIGKIIIPDIYLPYFSQSKNFPIFIGIIIVGLIVFLITKTKKSHLSLAFFVTLSWTIFSFIFSWFRDPEISHPTHFRYLIPTAVGIAIFFGSIITLPKQSKNRLKLFLLMLLILGVHIFTTRDYLIKEGVNSHGREQIDKMIVSLPDYSKLNKNNGPIVYYFNSVPEKQNLLYYGVQFGLPYRIAFLSKEFDTNAYYRMPLTMGEWKEVVSAVTDGKSLVPRGQVEKAVSIENIYAFYLDQNNNLTDITSQIRTKLTEQVSAKTP